MNAPILPIMLQRGGRRLPPGKPDDFIWRISLDQYHAMIQEGILAEDDQVELLEGWLVVKMPKKPLHSVITEILRSLLQPLLPPGFHVRHQEPISLPADDSEPEPDLAVVRGHARDYLERHPGPDDIALVIEVADSTLERDRKRKRSIYARSSIVVYWIVNLVDRQIELYADPSGQDDAVYRQERIYVPGGEVPVEIFGERRGVIPLASLFS